MVAPSTLGRTASSMSEWARTPTPRILRVSVTGWARFCVSILTARFLLTIPPLLWELVLLPGSTGRSGPWDCAIPTPLASSLARAGCSLTTWAKAPLRKLTMVSSAPTTGGISAKVFVRRRMPITAIHCFNMGMGRELPSDAPSSAPPFTIRRSTNSRPATPVNIFLPIYAVAGFA